ncbi:MAG: helix-turn-helix transcriptional regulator [Anaerolineales bacterium]|nr:helix-turn-helix transcriptional regulator [Anaerolineales bacterium]
MNKLFLSLNDELVQSLQDLAQWEDLPELYIAAELVKLALQRAHPRQQARLLAASLTHRERQVALLLHQGLSRRQICLHLHIAPETLRTHLRNIRMKFDLRSMNDLPAALANLPPAMLQPPDPPCS